MKENWMSEVGIRELRDNLSRYISQVRDGGEVVVTDHGRAVARIVSLDRPRILDELIAAGHVTAAAESERSRPERRIAATGPVSPLVVDQRR
jgi:prevent-host-death family protein